MPWRNGGGITYEIASSPEGAGPDEFDWRISIAEVQANGPFSSFAGIDRTIVLIEGEWMALTVDGRRHRFGVHDPFAFDGGAETACEVAGPSRDLNVMTRRGRTVASLAVADAAAVELGAIEATEVVFVCLSPAVTLTDADGTEVTLGALDAAVSGDGAARAIRGDGTVAVIGLAPATTS